MASITDLGGTADQILQLFAAQLTEQGVDVPERQYRPPGTLVVWDGEQLTVNLMGIGQGQPGHGYGQTIVPPQALVFYASFSINLIRAITVINVEGPEDIEIPTAAEMDADGVKLLADAQALVLAFSQIYQRYQVTAIGEGMVLDGLQPVGPEGGLAGSRMLVSVSLS